LQHYADADGKRVPESIVTYAMVDME